jgi:hypothetical protein
LTPNPNKIPENGSTIKIFVDGVYIGHATYNLYRGDVAGLFPGYANSNGAWGYLDFDTTVYTNGVHTIAWSVSDSAGNSEGIGSRYFSVMNTGGASKSNTNGYSLGLKALPLPGNPLMNPEIISFIPRDDSYNRPIRLKTGYKDHTPSQELYPHPDNVDAIEIDEMERITLRLPGYTVGYMVVKDRLRCLPVGSGMDPKTGQFSWQPGPGFLGTYEFVFIGKQDNGTMVKKYLRVSISPAFKSEIAK